MPFKFNPLTKKLDLVDVTAIPPGTVVTLTGDTGGAVGPDGSGNINLLGDGGIVTVGNSGTNTITINAVPSGAPWNIISTSQTLLTNNYYYVESGNPTLNFPDASTVSVGDVFAVSGNAFTLNDALAGNYTTVKIENFSATIEPNGTPGYVLENQNPIATIYFFCSEQFTSVLSTATWVATDLIGSLFCRTSGGGLSGTVNSLGFFGFDSGIRMYIPVVDKNGTGTGIQKVFADGSTGYVLTTTGFQTPPEFQPPSSLGAVMEIAMQTGASPIVPNASGLVTFNGAVVAAGTNPVRTDGTAANEMTLEVQISQALAAADATKIGLSNFDSASFSVAATGFVSMAGGGGFTWSDTSGAFSAAKNNGYFITGTATANLPAGPSQGDTIKFYVDHATQDLTIDAPGTQLIRFGNSVSSAGGTATSTLQGDSVTLVYRASNTTWQAVDFVGAWVLA